MSCLVFWVLVATYFLVRRADAQRYFNQRLSQYRDSTRLYYYHYFSLSLSLSDGITIALRFNQTSSSSSSSSSSSFLFLSFVRLLRKRREREKKTDLALKFLFYFIFILFYKNNENGLFLFFIKKWKIAVITKYSTAVRHRQQGLHLFPSCNLFNHIRNY